MQLSKKPGIRPTHRNGKMNANIDLLHCSFIPFLRQRNHNKFATDMNPKTIHSRHTAHGIKYEPVAVDRYHKYMHSQKTPVHVFKCRFVVCGTSPILGAL